MPTLFPQYFEKMPIHPSLVWSISQCSEFKGLQDLWRKTKPELISEMRKSAMVQSVESSNRIEGVEIEKSRMRPLVLGRARAQNRSEEEIVGYRKALVWIYENYQKETLTPKVIQKIHLLAQGGMISDAGEWKSKDNEIIEFNDRGDRRVRFRCTTAKETPKAIADLCSNYQAMMEKPQAPDLLVVGCFVFDFLCIHPFRDGNGRVSRLLTLLCLLQCGYFVGRFISLERLIEDSKERYYETLGLSSQSWHESRHDMFPWLSFFMNHLRTAYQELRDRVELSQSYEDTKSELIRGLISEMQDTFAISDILKIQPGLDREIVKKNLQKMKEKKEIRLLGSGRGARWKKIKSR